MTGIPLRPRVPHWTQPLVAILCNVLDPMLPVLLVKGVHPLAKLVTMVVRIHRLLSVTSLLSPPRPTHPQAFFPVFAKTQSRRQSASGG